MILVHIPISNIVPITSTIYEMNVCDIEHLHNLSIFLRVSNFFNLVFLFLQVLFFLPPTGAGGDCCVGGILE